MNQDRMAVTVSRVEQVSPTTKMFEFTSANNSLVPCSAGSHIVIHMDEVDIQRAYSLINDLTNPNTYSIAVLLDQNSKGGSAYMHQSVKEGDQLFISPANNFFPLINKQDDKHILIAGGIGITPFMSYLYEIEREGLDYELHYTYRDANTAAFIAELQERLGDKLFTYDNSQDQKLNVESLIANNANNSHVYVCGPKPLIDAVIDSGNKIVGEERVHFENFGEVETSGDSFEVHFKQSGFSLNVGKDMSILQAIEADNRIDVECMCRNGVCGTCETDILEGEADHRDNYLDDDEKAAQETIMVCVSRSKGPRLVLDL